MGCEKEKLSIVAEMIQSSKCNNAIEQIEYEFICSFSKQLGLDIGVVDEYMKEEEIFILPNTMSCKMLRFYKMAMSDKAQGKSYTKWIRVLYKQGLVMGLPPTTIRKFLYELHFCDDVVDGEQVIKNYVVHQ